MMVRDVQILRSL